MSYGLINLDIVSSFPALNSMVLKEGSTFTQLLKLKSTTGKTVCR